MASTPPPERLQSPNSAFTLASAFAALAWVAWPEAGSVWQLYIVAGFYTYVAAIACLSGVVALRKDYLVRRAKARAARPSHTHGQARFASLAERERAGLHDPSGKMLLGEVDGLPLFLPAQLSLSVQAPAGTGKTSALASAAALHAAQQGYALCISDVKPEIVHAWGPELERRGFRVVLNDPAELMGRD
ncbi:MAG: hypothetical protein AAGI34_07385 [Pseudomonadota bacterium]